ncbi:hypothetical protein PoB_005660700 [Plakobranchus ocellatus]|uniref:Uncharacterized protein n=1 Tax=Plakobranchus ocellatus TaxID=259542 RepID=A0AAV4CEW2_9GAST|nr:hypothetical protein PoB_005660700 [Plakobranchus ocellatus]
MDSLSVISNFRIKYLTIFSTKTLGGFIDSTRLKVAKPKRAKHNIIYQMKGASVAQWLASPPVDLQGSMYRMFELHHWRPGLKEGLKA